MPAISISVPEMVDLALATPDVGGVNLNVLHSLMQIIVKKLDMTECRVEFRGARSDVIETLVGRMPKVTLVEVEEFEIDPTDETKRLPVERDTEDGKNIFTINHHDATTGKKKEMPPGFPLQPIQVFNEDDFPETSSKVPSIHDVTAPVLPSSEDLLQIERGDSNAIFDMYKMLNLEKRLEAVEAALRRANQITKAISDKTEISQSKFVKFDGTQKILPEILNRIGLVEEAVANFGDYKHRVSKLSSKFRHSTASPSKKSQSSRKSSRGGSTGGNYGVSEVSVDRKDSEVIESEDGQTLVGPSFIGGGRLNEANENPIAGISDWEALLSEDNPFVPNLLKLLLQQLCAEELNVDNCKFLQKFRTQIINDIYNDPNMIKGEGRLFSSAGFPKNKQGNVDTQKIGALTLTKAYRDQWFTGCSKEKPVPCNVLKDYDVLVHHLLIDDFFLGSLARLVTPGCVCPCETVKFYDFDYLVSNQKRLETRLDEFLKGEDEQSFPYHKDTLQKTWQNLEKTTNIVSEYYKEFLQTMGEIQAMLDAKFDKCHVCQLKEFVGKEIENIRAEFMEALNKNLYPDASVGAYNLVKDLRCVSCKTEVCMKDRSFPANVPKYPNAPESKVLKAIDKQLCHQPTNRFCGGRHTVTRPGDRLWRTGYFLDQFNVHPPSADVTLAEGANGRMYRVDPPKSECICLEPVVEENNRCEM